MISGYRFDSKGAMMDAAVMTNGTTLSTREKVAAIISGAIIIGAIIYWIVQIIGVMEILKLAYG
jgi:hypothetical protein